SDAHVRVLRFDGDHIILSTVGASSDRKEECLSLKTASQIMSLSPIRSVSLRPHCYTNWQKILGRREGMFDNLRDGPVPCVGRGCDSISATVPKKVQNWKVRGRNCLNLVSIGHSIFHDQVSSAERSAKLRRLGGDGRIQMNSKLTKLAAAGVLSLCTAVP